MIAAGIGVYVLIAVIGCYLDFKEYINES